MDTGWRERGFGVNTDELRVDFQIVALCFLLIWGKIEVNSFGWICIIEAEYRNDPLIWYWGLSKYVNVILLPSKAYVADLSSKPW